MAHSPSPSPPSPPPAPPSPAGREPRREPAPTTAPAAAGPPAPYEGAPSRGDTMERARGGSGQGRWRRLRWRLALIYAGMLTAILLVLGVGLNFAIS
ncbi:MAG TPA: hypothetical protein VLJ14_16175, partial [Ktedonobacterales bacterium]|nr:hypothetical protein [Ktedonobacterales bacterium]